MLKILYKLFRLLKKLKEKDEKQLDLEKREQGFSLYLNGANVGLHLSGNFRPRKSKTAGGMLLSLVFSWNLLVVLKYMYFLAFYNSKNWTISIIGTVLSCFIQTKIYLDNRPNALGREDVDRYKVYVYIQVTSI